MALPQYDDKDWPLFRVVVPRTDMSDDEFAQFLATLDALPQRATKYAILIDVRGAPPLSAKRRQLLGEHGNAAYARYPAAITGVAIVLNTALQRGIFTAIHWMMRQPHHVRAFTSPAEAEVWLRGRLRESGVRAMALGE